MNSDFVNRMNAKLAAERDQFREEKMFAKCSEWDEVLREVTTNRHERRRELVLARAK